MIHTHKDFNETHPELLPGEVFLTNTKEYPDAFRRISSHKTLRFGRISYTIHGERIRNMRPVFAQKDEVEKAKETAHAKLKTTLTK